MVTSFGSGAYPEEKLPERVRRCFTVRPADIIEQLDLLRPIYRATAVGGHFGRLEPQFTWERTDRAAVLQDDSQVKKVVV
jgi:S-adenosylmethionine synthetase